GSSVTTQVARPYAWTVSGTIGDISRQYRHQHRERGAPDRFDLLPERTVRDDDPPLRLLTAQRQGNRNQKPADDDEWNHIGDTIHQMPVDRVLFLFLLILHFIRLFHPRFIYGHFAVFKAPDQFFGFSDAFLYTDCKQLLAQEPFF